MYTFFLSLRYFRSRFLAFAAFLAITFGVAMLLIVQSVMGGYMTQLRKNIRGQESHIQVVGPGQLGVRLEPDGLNLEDVLATIDNVAATAPYIERLGIFRSGVSIRPTQIHGVNPARQALVSDFGRYVLRPDELDAILAEHVPPPPTDSNTVFRETKIPDAVRDIHMLIHSDERSDLSGAELERFFDLDFRAEILEKHRPESVGDFVIPPPGVIVGIHMLLERVVSLGEIMTINTLSPDTGNEIEKTLLVVGAAKTGDFDMDSGTLYADIDFVRNMLNKDIPPDVDQFRVQGIRVALEDPTRLEETRDAIAKKVDGVHRALHVKTWKELRQNMLKAVGIEKLLVYFIVLILVVFTGSMILLMLLLTVIEKTRDIGILMSLGATANGVTAIFLINGLVISILGTLAGLGLGYLFAANINDIHDAIYAVTGRQLFPPEIYHMDRIPVAFEPLDLLWTTGPPVLIGMAASLIPAVWAPRRDPIKSIHSE
jgi:lipoprotein-releasing system permease protein